MNTETTETIRGYVFYDAECAFCTGWVVRLSGPLLRRGYHFVPLQSPRATRALGLKAGKAPAEMKLLTARGDSFGGADSLVKIAESIWWAWPAVLLASLPGGLALMRLIYRRIAEKRHCLGKTCAVKDSRRAHACAIASGFYDMP